MFSSLWQGRLGGILGYYLLINNNGNPSMRLNLFLKSKSNQFLHLLTSCFLFLTTFILILFIHLSLSHAAQVTLAWDPSPTQDVIGYKIYYGASSHNYTVNVDVGKVTMYTISTLESGKTYYLAATAYDIDRIESDFTNELAYTVPSECTYSISPTSQSFNASGGSGTVNVTTPSGCSWTATSNASWLVITSNSSVTGNGVVNYSVSANTNASSRTGTLTIAGKTFTVTQSGVSQYTLTITKAGTGSGTVTNNLTGTTFSAGTVVTLTATPNTNSTFTGWSGGYTGTSSTCTITMNANISVTATFTLKTYTITASAGANGSVSPSGSVKVNYGASQTFTITPNTNYSINDVKVDGASVGKVSSYTFTNVTANHTIEASFTLISSSQSYTITASVQGSGSIMPSGEVIVRNGGRKNFTIRHKRGYKITDVKVDGVSVGKTRSYRFRNVTSNHTITATFGN